ncbi:MAG: DUF1292 domain-containing protein [Clostridiales bacterium]|jgi:uncharacterized protein YrzB (UPF0473 family)|uniref:DUF1292 domain-containing protein n=1 Tax=Chordicoccus furentiruminis TaxID=2709410 RepID=UPI0023A8E252|nr:DUF1292 domain-containing protein [Chordicoccus furentiruminis]MCI6174071.1 DUF1292 domain-containing protein [Clostridiales bacterium]
MTETVTFTGENGEQTVFYIEEQARVNGTDYLLVSDAPEGDANALILKDISDEASAEAEYVPVEDEAELAALMKVFNEMTDDDTDILM